MRLPGRGIVLCLLAASASVCAQGGPPMLTDDPGTPDVGHWEINIAYGDERTASETTLDLPRVDINYGLGKRVQVKYETAWLAVRGPEADWQGGFDNSIIGLKWRFLDRGKDAVRASLHPQLEFENSRRAVAKEVAEPGPNTLLPLQASLPLGPLRLVGEVGYRFQREAHDELVYGLLTAMELSGQFEIIAELYATAPRGGGRTDSIVQVGLRRSIAERMRLLASVGTGLGNDVERTRFLAYLGIQLLLGKEAS